ncbi:MULTISPECIES: hypothetical protein [Plantibacter]|uniref:hypothetical protein n=1 Tax=Plantibacter TaxID=190323 RepID=UPI0010C24150|nr:MULTISPECIES: hypothetical protein [Plantibacter]MBD8103801.1 hypothetical protein [Plantibacter sp. CFBP 8775]MBD8467249.1 hypothetical protein [Plantibacter sp. CFBP 8798]
MTTATPLTGTQHLEIFTSKRTGDGIHVPCWCSIAHDHTYADWQAAGSPDTSGRHLVSEPATAHAAA